MKTLIDITKFSSKKFKFFNKNWIKKHVKFNTDFKLKVVIFFTQ